MYSKEKNKQKIRKRLKQRIRKKISGTPDCPRLVVIRGNRNIMAQLVDDENHKTLATIASVARKYDDFKKNHSGKIELSLQIGQDAADAVKKMKIDRVVFDRNGFQYHGRVKAVAEGARKGGLKF